MIIIYFFCVAPVEVVCEEDEFPCHDGQQCITDMSHCDGIVQCDDGSDELHCRKYCMYMSFYMLCIIYITMVTLSESKKFKVDSKAAM